MRIGVVVIVLADSRPRRRARPGRADRAAATSSSSSAAASPRTRCRATPGRRSRSASPAPCGPSRASGHRRCAGSRSRSTRAAGSTPAACRSAAAAEIEPSSTAEALARCGSALVGRGSYDADVAFPEQSAFPSHGRILAFNAVIDGRRAILAHVYGAEPIPITRIIVFHIRETAGTYGTILTGFLPASLNRYGLPEADQPQPAPRLHLQRPAPQLSQRRLRRSGRLLRRDLPLRPGLDALRRRSLPVVDPDPQLQGPGLAGPAAAVILAIDQGTTGTHLPRLRRRGQDRRPRLLGVRAALPAAGLGRARRRTRSGR